MVHIRATQQCIHGDKMNLCKICYDKADIHDIDVDEYYCMTCWHNYPTGFKTRGWEFV